VLNYQKRHAARLFAEDALFRPAMLFDDLVQPLPVLAVEIVLSLDSLLPLLSQFLAVRAGHPVHQIHHLLTVFLTVLTHLHQFAPHGVTR
jgi:hypothetical protein